MCRGPAAAPSSPRRRRRNGASDLAWQEVALGAPRGRQPARSRELLAAAARGHARAQLRLPRPAPAADGGARRRARPRGRRPGAWERGPVEGVAALRAWFAREAGGGFGAHDVVICPGGQAALVTAVRALAPPGGSVVVESPTYRGALAAVRAAGLTPVPVPSDADGVRPALLADALARTGARVAYLQPLHANPHGADLSAERRAQVMEVAARAGAFLIEDDWARDLTIDGPAPAPLAADDADGHVVYVRSLSKGASPGLRVARSRRAAPRGRACARPAWSRTCSSARPLQYAALELVSSPGWRRHLRALRTGLRERRDAMTGALAEHFGAEAVWRVPSGGLHLWLRLPDGTDEAGLVAAAARAGVIVSGCRRELRRRADRPAPAADVRRRAAGRPRRGRGRLAALLR